MIVALIDGPLPPDYPDHRRMDLVAVRESGTAAEAHAVAIAETIRQHAIGVSFVNLVVFGGKLTTTADAVAAALHVAAEEGTPLVHCSLGLGRADDGVIAATKRSLQQQRLVAASPARGGPVWPAATEGVLAVQGDARCAPDCWSVLSPTLWGACPQNPRFPTIAGASMAAAHFTGHLAAAGGSLSTMRKDAAYFGRERRLS